MICNLCPRRCSAVRGEYSGSGFCNMGTVPVVARIAPHFGEEPCISGKRGSGAVFFSGCTMRCRYCQNYEISAMNQGRIMTPEQLADSYRRLEAMGVHNINLVTADHFAPAVVKSLELHRPSVPVVYNCSGYTSPVVLHMLEGLVDVYLPDFKYGNDALAVSLSQAPNYVSTATVAVQEMVFQTGTPTLDDDGMLTKGVMVRHLILPAHTRNSIEVIEHIRRHFGKQVLFSLMCQYVPWGEVKNDPKLGRTITKREAEKVKRELFRSGMDGFTQDLTAATAEYIPQWDI